MQQEQPGYPAQYPPPPGGAPPPPGYPPPPGGAPPPGYGPPQKERPAGVIIIAVLLFIGGGLNLLSGMLNLTSAVAPELWEIAPALMALYAINAIVGILYIVIAIGLIQLKPWARTLTIILAIVGIILQIAVVGVAMAIVGELAGDAAAAAVGTMALICASIPILINVIIIAYMFTAKVKYAFGVT